MEQKASEPCEILLYQNGDDREYIRVILQDENFWLTQVGMTELFDASKSNISQYLTHIFEGEYLDKAACMRKFGNSGFSAKAARFRPWAAKTLKGGEPH